VTVKHLQAFLGLFNFYRRFIPAAAKVVLPLTRALRGGPKGTTTLVWTPAMAAAFLAARGALSSSAVLAHAAAGAEISLVTDASATHVSAVVQQRHHGKAWRPLGFFSAQLSKAEANYSAFDRELLAVVAAICHFRYMLEGCSFVVFTDHKPLVGTLHRRSDPISARQQRHLSFIAEFAPSIRHNPGASNVVSDTLSRPSSECSHPSPSGPAAPSVAATYNDPSEADQGSTEVKAPSGSSVPPRRRWAASSFFPCGPSRTGGSTARLPRLPARQLFFSSTSVGGFYTWGDHTGRHLIRGLQAPRHRRLKDALRAWSAGTDWFQHLPWVLLGLRAAPREDSGISAAELVYGCPLSLLGQFLSAAEPSPGSFVSQLQS
jgi:hypothetical protein